jgi:hypothetical protein
MGGRNKCTVINVRDANYIRYVRHVRRAIQIIHIAVDECG